MKNGRRNKNVFIVLFAAIVIIPECIEQVRVTRGEWTYRRTPKIRFTNPVIIKDSSVQERLFIANLPTDDINDIGRIYPITNISQEKLKFMNRIEAKTYFRLKKQYQNDKYRIYFEFDSYSQSTRFNPGSFTSKANIELYPTSKEKYDSNIPWTLRLKFFLYDLRETLFMHTYKDYIPEAISISKCFLFSNSLFLKTNNQNQFIRVEYDYCGGCEDVFFYPLKTLFKLCPQIEEVGHASWDSSVCVYKVQSFDISNFKVHLELQNDSIYDACLVEE